MSQKERLISEKILTHEAFLELEAEERVFYLSLLFVVDDIGNSDITNKALFHRWHWLDCTSEKQVAKILQRFIDLELVIPYEAEKYSKMRRHLHIPQEFFDQKLRWYKIECQYPDWQEELVREIKQKQKVKKSFYGSSTENLRSSSEEVDKDTDKDTDKIKTLSIKSKPKKRHKTTAIQRLLVTQDVKEILEHLNDRSGFDYKPSTRSHCKAIADCLQIHSKQELKTMIDDKARQWANNPDMRRFLRPSTLFRKTKCAEYVEQSNAPEIIADASGRQSTQCVYENVGVKCDQVGTATHNGRWYCSKHYDIARFGNLEVAINE